MEENGAVRRTDDGTAAVTSVDETLRARASRVVPGGMYGHLNAAELPRVFPQFYVSGEGCRILDVDGNEYIDFMCSWGPIVLGHNHPAVEAAVAAETLRGVCLNGPGEVLVELAELLTAEVTHAEWAMFGKNGTDATNMGLRIARAATGHSKVLIARRAYHGIGTWSLPPGSDGVTEADRADTIYFEYNDLDSLDAAIAEAGDDIAAVIVTPIRHEVHRDLDLATPEFAAGVRSRCDATGAQLMIDDIRCGFRMDLAGSWEGLGIRPDLTAYSKALANGHPLAALVGSEHLREAAGRITATGSFWFAAPPMAAAIATIQTLKAEDGIARMAASGLKFQQGLRDQAKSHGFEVSVTGPPQLPFMSFAADASEEKAFAWTSECAARGVYLHPFHNWFLNAAHDEPAIDDALARTDAAFAALRTGFGSD
ncbi:MAG TPA: aminotransferase class III-fold pyridoxal phosphate-dependent enzyme [Solirubrobacterales bacterium]|nr:aminotransferase class III-fold pyridoxal phosphate-dependent enzyme [Solirubrobacterales bacterium]